MAVKPNENDLEWYNKWDTLDDYYNNNFDTEYYSFDRYEREIDPRETMENVEAYDPQRQQMEIIKCARSFPYFCYKYVKIAHPTRGLLPFILYNYQRRVVQEYEDHRFSIIRKFRQGGLTTVTVLWSLWRCMFKLDEIIMVLSKSDREAIAAGEIAKRAIEEFPSWMRPEMDKNNDHQKFFTDTGCKLFFYTPEAARGRSITYLILDEAAFIPNMEKFWKAMFPTISTGGHCIAISTVNGVGNWYEETYHAAERGDNFWHIIDLMYTEHPDYDDDDWVKSTRAQLGENGWKQEVMGDFLGAGDTWIPPNIMNDYELELLKIEPVRILFPEWISEYSSDGAASRKPEEGALLIWKEPREGREYVIGVDAAEGLGAQGDHSCAQIIDVATCEQVAEFYSNTCPNHIFAQIISQLGVLYNTALVVVENERYGATVLNRLEHDLHYENLYETIQGKSSKIGVKTTQSNRPTFLDGLKSRMLSKTIPVWSLRFIKELKTFIVNPKTKRAEAQNGGHDDSILALALALYARDQQFRQSPVGAEMVQEDIADIHKAEVYEQIRQELEKGNPDSWDFDDDDTLIDLEVDFDEIPTSIITQYSRPHDGILKEFGW